MRNICVQHFDRFCGNYVLSSVSCILIAVYSAVKDVF